MSYFNDLVGDINAIHADVFANLEHLGDLPRDVAIKIMQKIAGCACHATHMGNIDGGRKLFMVIPKSIFVANHEEITRAIDLNDEWDYRRWMELLDLVAPELLPKFLAIGHKSPNEGIREAADDYEEGVLAPYIWYLFRLKDHWPNKEGVGLLPGIPRHLLTEDKVGQIGPGATLLFISPEGEFRRLKMSTFSIRVPRETDNPNLMNELPLIPIVPEHDIQDISPVGSLVYWEMN